MQLKKGEVKMGSMELKGGTRVFTADSKGVGKVSRFVLDPATHEVTHIVVQKGWLFSEDKAVPFEMVQAAEEDIVVLSENISRFRQLPPFEETHYIGASEADVSRGGSPRDMAAQPEQSGGAHHDTTVEEDISQEGARRHGTTPSYYSYPPRRFMGYPAMGTTRNIPAHTIPLNEGTEVISSDGEHVGSIESLFVASDSNKATYFVVSQGLFFKRRKLIPAPWVETVEEDQVELTVSSKQLEELPAYEPE
jgi:sporulation protein YlmC with PRC-barrel domain